MGIGRPDDPYGMTAPPAWPEADEDVVNSCADTFDGVAKTVAAQWQSAVEERSTMFHGVGIWSGKGATAAWRALDKRVDDLEAVKKKFEASAQLFRDSHDAVKRAKEEIIDNVNFANNLIKTILKSDRGTDADKEAAIQAMVDAVRRENAFIVATEGAKISGNPPPVGPGALNSSGNGLNFFGPQEPKEAPVIPISNLVDPGNTGVGESREPVSVAPVPPSQPATNLDPGEAGAGDERQQAPAPQPPPTQPANSADPGTTGAGQPGAELPPPGPAPGIPLGPEGVPPGAAAPGAPAPGMPGGITGLPGGPSAPASPGRVGVPSNPLSSGTPTPSTAGVPTTANPAAAASQAQMAEFQRAVSEATRATAAQPPMPQPQPSPPMGAAPAAQPPTPPPLPDTPAAPPTPAPPNASGPSGVGGGGAAPVTPGPGTGAPPGGAMPLGPAPTPPPAAPVPPATPIGPGVAAAAAAGAASAVGAPAPVPVSAARAQREAMAAAATAGALRRRATGGNDPAQLAHRIGAALNASVTDVGLYWITGLAKDGTIIVANNYGLGYIPETVNLPEHVKMATADESIPATVRGTWVTYPILALHGWAQRHNNDLRAVIATEDQFKGFDPGAPKVILQPDDIPDNGQMEGRSRLQVIAPDAATKLAAVSDAGLVGGPSAAADRRHGT